MRRLAFLLAVCFLPNPARDVRAQSVTAAPAPILVELFTSEGCSDCPPADALLRQIRDTRTPQGQPIFVLSEHVTYWDRFGWKDRFSDESFTGRQNDYAQHFNLDSVYTPQMVVNGKKQFVGNNIKALRDALLAEPPKPRTGLRIVSVQRDGNELLVHFTLENLPVEQPGKISFDVMAAIADDQDETHVEQGENKGRTLTHVSVARSLTRLAVARGNTEQTARIPWPSSLKGSPETPRHLLLFLQQHSYGPIVAVAGQPIH